MKEYIRRTFTAFLSLSLGRPSLPSYWKKITYRQQERVPPCEYFDLYTWLVSIISFSSPTYTFWGSGKWEKWKSNIFPKKFPWCFKYWICLNLIYRPGSCRTCQFHFRWVEHMSYGKSGIKWTNKWKRDSFDASNTMYKWTANMNSFSRVS